MPGRVGSGLTLLAGLPGGLDLRGAEEGVVLGGLRGTVGVVHRGWLARGGRPGAGEVGRAVGGLRSVAPSRTPEPSRSRERSPSAAPWGSRCLVVMGRRWPRGGPDARPPARRGRATVRHPPSRARSAASRSGAAERGAPVAWRIQRSGVTAPKRERPRAVHQQVVHEEVAAGHVGGGAGAGSGTAPGSRRRAPPAPPRSGRAGLRAPGRRQRSARRGRSPRCAPRLRRRGWRRGRRRARGGRARSRAGLRVGRGRAV